MTTPLTVLDLFTFAAGAALVWFRGWESLAWLVVGAAMGIVWWVTMPARGQSTSASSSTNLP